MNRRGHSPGHRIRSVRACRLGASYHLRRAERGEISAGEARTFVTMYRQLSELVMAEKTLAHSGILDTLETEHPDGNDQQLEPQDTRRHVAEKAKLKMVIGGQEIEIQVDGPAAMVEAIRQVAVSAPLLMGPQDQDDTGGPTT